MISVCIPPAETRAIVAQQCFLVLDLGEGGPGVRRGHKECPAVWNQAQQSERKLAFDRDDSARIEPYRSYDVFPIGGIAAYGASEGWTGIARPFDNIATDEVEAEIKRKCGTMARSGSLHAVKWACLDAALFALHLANIKDPRSGGPAFSLDDIKRFRQLDSKCPGHPEYQVTAGVETTRGHWVKAAA